MVESGKLGPGVPEMPVTVPGETLEVVVPLSEALVDVDKGSAERISEAEIVALPLVVVVSVLPGTLLVNPLGSLDATSEVAVLG